MNRTELFNIWAPANAHWSVWVKPVLFAHASHRFLPVQLPTFLPAQIDLFSPADKNSVLIIDLPGVTSIALGMSVAEVGYRPIPLFNAIPASTEVLGSVSSAVDVSSIIASLVATTPRLAELHLPLDAPPAFLLDARRRYGAGASLQPGMFDNRSLSLPTDFPSGNLLLSRGFTRVILIGEHILGPQPDLSHTLLRWQNAGLQILSTTVESSAAPTPIRITKPPFFRSIFHRLLATTGLRPNPLGGFGGTLPIPHASSFG